MKKNILSLILIGLISVNISFAEEGSSGTRGGGERINDRLRDLVDPGTCIPVGGEEFADEYTKGWREILNKLGNTHWYFAYKIKEQIESLTVCLVRNNLKRIVTTDPDSVMYYKDVSGTMVAIRLDQTVYISKPSLMKLYKADRPYFFIHEAMHGLVPVEIERRNEKVRGLVNAVREVVKGRIGKDKLGATLEFYNSTVPPMYNDECIGQRDAGEKIFGSYLSSEYTIELLLTGRVVLDLRLYCVYEEKDRSHLYSVFDQLKREYDQAVTKGDFEKANKLIHAVLDTGHNPAWLGTSNERERSTLGYALKYHNTAFILNVINNYKGNYELGIESVQKTEDLYPATLKDFFPHDGLMVRASGLRIGNGEYYSASHYSFSDRCDYYKGTLLMNAIIQGNYDLFKVELKNGGYALNKGLAFFDSYSGANDLAHKYRSLTDESVNFWSPLALAIIFNRVQMVKDILASKNFDRDYLEKARFLPLTKSYPEQFDLTYNDRIKFLDCTFKAASGEPTYTIVDLAVRQKHYEIARILEKEGAQCKYKCKELRNRK